MLTIVYEVALADGHQRAVLVTGTELVLYVGNRLRVYLDIYAQLSRSYASDNFHKALVNLYAHLLAFLANAIRIQQKTTTARVIQGFWDLGSLTRFESECDNLCLRASEEARICEGEQSKEWREKLDARLQSLDEIHRFHGSLVELEDKADLAKLITAREATYDSAAEGEQARCLPGTRTVLLDLIAGWAANPNGERIFWLCGKAGTGKSTIARSVAHQLEAKGLLGASFFFKRGWADRSHAKLVFPTIARQLADAFPEVGHAIASSLDQDSLICDKHLRPQFDKLLFQPLQALSHNIAPLPGVVLVIDALDECDNSESIKAILMLLAKVEAITPVRLRIFVTSRPELPVELGFKDISGHLHHDVRLEEVQQTSIRHDIRIFYEHQFSEIRKNSQFQFNELPAEWPGENSINLLVEQAAPLFIFAFTVSRYVSEVDPRGRLDIMLRQSRKRPLKGLEGTYLPVLKQLVASDDEEQQADRIAEFRTVIGSIILLYDPLSPLSLSKLLGIPIEDVGRAIQPFDSVLNIPRNADGRPDTGASITLFHLSFRDFLVDQALRKENMFWIEPATTHLRLATDCIRLLESGALREDACGMKMPGARRGHIAGLAVQDALSGAVSYACCYWVYHMVTSGGRVRDDGIVLKFLKKHVLHWIEALGWLGKSSEVVRNIETLRSAVDVSRRISVTVETV